MIQQLLVYITLALSVGYIAYKYLVPKSIWGSKKQSDSKACGQNDCGCH